MKMNSDYTKYSTKKVFLTSAATLLSCSDAAEAATKFAQNKLSPPDHGDDTNKNSAWKATDNPTVQVKT